MDDFTMNKKQLRKGVISAIMAAVLTVAALPAYAHPGRTDGNGGHQVKTEGWGYDVGTYHYHDKYGNIIPVEKSNGTPLGISVIVNGETVSFDQQPVIIDGRTLVPVRAVVEKLGCSVEWDSVSQTVYIKNSDMQNVPLSGDEIKVAVNNEQVYFDVLPTILNGRTLIPIRAVVEKLGCSVEWDGELQIIYIDIATL